MLSNKALQSRNVGAKKESAAEQYLKQQGLRLTKRNFSCRTGEIDLIMQDGDTLVFVEVRYRNTSLFGNSLESITYQKQRRIIRTAEHYLQKCKLHDKDARFDVIAIDGVGKNQKITWVKNAFELI